MAKHRLPWWRVRMPNESAMIQLSALFVVLLYGLYLVIRLAR